MEIDMKPVYIAVVVLLFVVLQAPVLMANEAQELRTKSDQYYEKSDFKKAYKGYYKLAKAGDRYSQNRISQMYANGEGKSVDLTEAYAWSAVAAESGKEQYVKISDELLLKTQDKAAAEKRATKLVDKYGKAAQKERSERMTAKENDKRSGRCTGTRMGCSRG
jgi:TPR repeat protein